jgi:uncharacterized protein
MPNRLAKESSPYLLQHADNPVDWYPWGPEALQRAASEDKPILLSIGYAACHWCHVMAHESFEDEETARLMNELYVNVKVDREERPDLDGIYMQAVQAMTGHGGWPMTVFLTPEGEPFYGGTYYPPEDRHGMPSFRRVLRSVHDAWVNRREALGRTATALRDIYTRASAPPRSSGQASAATMEAAYRGLASQYDPVHGGFGGAPKFPPTMSLDFLLRFWKRTGTSMSLEMAMETFRHMARGGIYDQAGGGFHRYAVDAIWLVPHFEKMLYDNALLVRLGAHLWQATKDDEVARVTRETVGWLEREMTSPEGGFYSSLDADSEGHEGKFYVWSAHEIDEALGDDSAFAREAWGVTAGGNFEGANILHLPAAPEMMARRAGIPLPEFLDRLDKARHKLYETRARRVWPGRDEKIVASWNGMMLRGVAECARVFGEPAMRSLALRNAEFLLRSVVKDGRVSRLASQDRVGFLEDHAAVALGFMDVHALTFDRRWLDAARDICSRMVEHFWDRDGNVFFDTADDAEKLITRPRDVTDNAIPSGTSLAVELLQQVGDVFNDTDLLRRASWMLETLAEPMATYPQAFGHLLGAADMAVHGAVEVVLVGDPSRDDFRRLARTVAMTYVPSLVLAGGEHYSNEDVALLAGREIVDGKATAHVCRGYSCALPTGDPELLAQQLEDAGKARPS